MFFDYLAGEYNWVGSSENIAGATEPKSRGADHVIEGPRLGASVVIAVTCLDVLVVRSAVQNHVAFQFGIAGSGVVGDFIRVEHRVAIVNLGLPAQLVKRTVLFLLNGSNRDLFLGQAGGRGGRRDGNGLGGAASGWLLSQGREGDDKAKGP